MDKRIEKVMRNLEKNRIQPYYAQSREELHELIRTLVKDDRLITSGGSMTLAESGVKDLLMTEFADTYLDRSAAKTPEEAGEIMRKAFISDTFLASTNALTEDGELYNVDGNGNRVSAMIFGPKQVVIVAGVNKIVKDMDEAVRRVETIAAPKNTVRLDCGTPCAKTGECAHCYSERRICCSYVKLAYQRVPNRIKVIIVNENLGY
ncbi:MAG: lactate utilization protein [Oscillospiraceae bacterium]